jgi:exopolysaccharide biosynthesis polyprenyl glycosylphosphotransferase
MGEGSSRAVETQAVLDLPVVAVDASTRPQRVWPRPGTRGWRHALLRRLLAFADVIAASFACLSLVVISEGDAGQLAWSLALIPIWVVFAKVLGLYDRDNRAIRHLTVEEAPMLALWALIGVSSLALFLDLAPADRLEASEAIVAGLVASISALALRGIARYAWRRMTPPARVAVVGSGKAASVLARKLELFADVHATLVSVHEDDWIAELAEHPSTLAEIDRVCFAPESLDAEQVEAVREAARVAGVRLSVVPPRPRLFGSGVRLQHLAELPLIEYNTADLSRSTLFLKRALDVVVSGLALFVLSPVLVLIAVAIKLDSRGPVLFLQRRAGLGGRPFCMHKFRSMVHDAEARLPALVPFDSLEEPMFKLPDDPRVTRIGRILRRWSLDELPQFWNVLAGDMSLVGPRPEQLELVELYTDEQRLRLAVKPGLTGPMQVYGRGALSLEERLAVECDYIENLSIGRDIHILGMTAAAVLKGKGAF